VASIIITAMATTGDFEDTITEATAIFEKLAEHYNCSPFIAIVTGLFCCDQKISH
jgi:hypothetical protein